MNTKNLANQTPLVISGLPAAGETIVLENSQHAPIQLNFSQEQMYVAREGNDLILAEDYSGQIILKDYFVLPESGILPEFILQSGSTIAGENLLAHLNAEDLQVCGNCGSSEPPSSGLNAYTDHSSSLLHSVNKLATLSLSKILQEDDPFAKLHNSDNLPANIQQDAALNASPPSTPQGYASQTYSVSHLSLNQMVNDSDASTSSTAGMFKNLNLFFAAKQAQPAMPEQALLESLANAEENTAANMLAGNATTSGHQMHSPGELGTSEETLALLTLQTTA